MSFVTWTRHEWTQLRLLRRVSLLLTFAVPFLLLAGAAASERGWLPGERIRVWDARTVLFDAAPMVLAVVWGLVAALATGQVFAGGRASGTEWLVLALPVSRGLVWRSRLCASVASTAVVAAASLAFLLVVARFATGRTPIVGWPAGAQAGVGAIVLSVLGTAAVAPLIRQPFQAALAGMVAGAAPLGIASWIASAFPLATTPRGMPIAFVAVAPMCPALLVLSFLVSTRGEPAGRGRLVRALLVVAVTFAVGLVAFVGVVTASVRLGRDLDRSFIVAAPSGVRAVGIEGHYGRTATLYDTVSGEAISLLARSTRLTGGWSADGSRFAMIDNVTLFGRPAVPRLTVWRASDGAVLERVALDDSAEEVRAVLWCGDRIVLEAWSVGLGVVLDGTLTTLLPPPREGEHISVLGCAADDTLLVAKGRSTARSGRRPNSADLDDQGAATETVLLRVPLDDHEAPRELSFHVDFAPWRSRWRMSPGGRFVLAQAREFGADSIEVLDVVDGSRYVLDGVDLGHYG